MIGALLLAAAIANASGHDLYDVHCSSCHGAALQGTMRAPALVNVDAAKVDFMLRTGRMPSQDTNEQQWRKTPRLTAEQIGAIESYVASRSSGEKIVDVPSPPPTTAQSLSRGRAVYEEHCEQCHAAGGYGNGAVGYHNVAPSILNSDSKTIAEAVREGPDVMPKFGPRVIDDAALADLSAYVRYLQKTPDNPGGAAMDNWGPVAEGLAAWFAGIGVLVLVARRIGDT